MQLLKTPLHSEHLRLRARMVPFAGYEMPVQYTGVIEETLRTRASASLFDVSHMVQLRIKGPHAMEEINKLVTNDFLKTRPHQAQYTLLCNNTGGVIDDLILYNQTPDEVFICANASNRAEDVSWLQGNLPKTLDLIDESEETALIALQGPMSEKILKGLKVDPTVLEHMYFYWSMQVKILGVDCFLSRTGYTGEDGFELYLAADKAAFIWNSILEYTEKEKIDCKPAGLGARDTLRTEMGYPLHGHEISPTISPLEAGLEWPVKFSKTEFMGKQALLAQKNEGIRRKLISFKLNDRRIARTGYPIVSGSSKVGEVTSGTLSPHLEAPVALALIDSQYVDKPLAVSIRTDAIAMEKVPLPFVPAKTKRLKK